MALIAALHDWHARIVAAPPQQIPSTVRRLRPSSHLHSCLHYSPPLGPSGPGHTPSAGNRPCRCAAAAQQAPRQPQGLSYDPARLVSMAQRLAQLQVEEAPELDIFFAASQQALPRFSPSQLASLARAVAEVGEEPPEAWGGALLQQVQRCANAATAKDVSDMLWACATLGLVPSTACVATLLQQAYNHMHELDSAAACDLAWAVAALQLHPGEPWLDALAAATYELELGALSAPEVSKLAWALASFNYGPPEEWLQDYAMQAVYHPTFSAQGSAAVLWSLAVFQVLPELLWMNAFYTTTATRLHEVPPDGLINILWSIAAVENSKAGANAKSDFTPVDLWLEEWYSEAGQFLQDLDRPSVVKLVWALAQLGLQPSDEWLEPVIVRASNLLQAHAFEPLEIAYLARSADTLLCPCDDDQHSNDDPPQQRPKWAQAFLRSVFEALAAAKLPPEWRRLNVKFPPYGVPRAGSVQMPVEEAEGQRRARLEAAAAAGALVPRGPEQRR